MTGTPSSDFFRGKDGLLSVGTPGAVAFYVISALVLFLAAHGSEFDSPARSVQDWQTVAGFAPNPNVSGRFLMRVLFHDVFSGVHLPTIHFIIAFLVMCTMPWLLLTEEERTNGGVFFVFGVASTHPFIVDALNYQAWAATMFLALLIGVLAFRLTLGEIAGKAREASRLGLGALLLCIGLMLYQPLALFGVIVPSLQLLRAESQSARQHAFVLGRAAGILIVGVMAYLIVVKASFNAFDIVPERRFSAGLRYVFDLELLRAFFQSIVPGLSGGATASYGVLNFALASCGLVLAILHVLRLVRSGDVRVLFFVIGGIGAVYVAVFNLSLLIDHPLPARARIGFDLGLAAAIVVMMTGPAGRSLREPVNRMPIRFETIAIVFVAILIAAGTISCGRLWSFAQSQHEEDVAMAGAIYNQVLSLSRTEDVRTDTVVLVGSHQGTKVFYSIKSGFHRPHGARGVMAALYDMDVEAVAPGAFPKTCAKFPEPGSIGVIDGKAFVCLTASD